MHRMTLETPQTKRTTSINHAAGGERGEPPGAPGGGGDDEGAGAYHACLDASLSHESIHRPLAREVD
jgi:hypothetical protein